MGEFTAELIDRIALILTGEMRARTSSRSHAE
jgi:hypothetical protein